MIGQEKKGQFWSFDSKHLKPKVILFYNFYREHSPQSQKVFNCPLRSIFHFFHKKIFISLLVNQYLGCDWRKFLSTTYDFIKILIFMMTTWTSRTWRNRLLQMGFKSFPFLCRLSQIQKWWHKTVTLMLVTDVGDEIC